jgi:hypothetical protein
MSYALAKKLKEAGFPQAGLGHWALPPDNLVSRTADRVYVPTLEELIDTCGDDLIELHRAQDTGRWFASGYGVVGEGSTHSEAVAHLWLAIQDKRPQ